MSLNFSNKGSYHERIIPSDKMAFLPAGPFSDSCPVRLPDGDWLDLPFLPLPPDFETAIAYLCITENSFEVEDRLSSAMADLVRRLMPQVVVGMPTLGMVLASSVARKLGHERYVPLSYSRKFWFEDELSVPVNSITTPTQPKTVYIDPRLLERLDNKRVLLVEDVISTGGTVSAELKLMERIGANVVGVVTAIQETNVWEKKLGAINPAWPALVHAPLRYPLFRKTPGGWMPDLGTMPGRTNDQ